MFHDSDEITLNFTWPGFGPSQEGTNFGVTWEGLDVWLCPDIPSVQTSYPLTLVDNELILLFSAPWPALELIYHSDPSLPPFALGPGSQDTWTYNEDANSFSPIGTQHFLLLNRQMERSGGILIVGTIDLGGGRHH